jgi:hypothetical protein
VAACAPPVGMATEEVTVEDLVLIEEEGREGSVAAVES